MDGYTASKKMLLCFLGLTGHIFSGQQLTSANTVFSDEDSSSWHSSLPAAARNDFRIDDLRDIEIGSPPVQDISADHFMNYLPKKSRNITTKERRAHVEAVLERIPTKRNGNQILQALQVHVARRQARASGVAPHIDEEEDLDPNAQRQVATRGLPISVSPDDIEPVIEPAIEWLAGKVLKSDVELLNHKFDRQKIITCVSTALAFLIANGFLFLIDYVGRFYQT
jgi:hypothetical protein